MRAEEIDAAIDELLPLPAEDERRVVEAMRYAALGGGKRLRGFLVIETAALFRADPRSARCAAAAVECLHAYSLIHDDLPAMDDDDLRRGRPTTHLAFDEATAILAGDALQTAAFEILLEPAHTPDAEMRARAAFVLAKAAGAAGMVGGQMIDIIAETREQPLEPDEIRRMQSLKTGALLTASVEIGAAIGGASASAQASLRRFGAALGAAFQVADDLLDATGDETLAGKRLRKDATAGKATLPEAIGAVAARREAEALVAAAEAELADFGPEADHLRQAARFSVARAH